MGYAKWRLGKGDQYQTDVERYRVARMLEVHAQGVEGPVALGCEVPIEGWDDIVEFGIEQDAVTVTYYQVKNQNTDFSAGELNDTFGKLFRSAVEILQKADPYDGLVVPTKRRRFVFVLPTGDITVGASLGMDQLRALLQKCVNMHAAEAIVANDGANIKDGKANGEQQRKWLAQIKTSAGTDDACARLLQQMRVEIWPSGFVDEQAANLLTSRFDNPERARLLIDAALRDNPPEGRLDAEELLAKLADALPKRELRRVRLARVGDECFVQPHTRQADLTVVADSIVKDVWSSHGAIDLHVGYPPPDDAKPLRLACVRLLLHARQSPVYVIGRDAWRARSTAEVAGAVGLVAGKGALDGAHYEEKFAPASLPPKAMWAADVLGDALHAAMDGHVWERVREEGKAVLEGTEGVPFEDLAASMKESEGFFDRVLRGWWEAEENASGVARAGPAVAPRVAQIVAGVAVLRHLDFQVAVADAPGTIARLGDLPVRALAIEQVSGIIDGLQAAVELAGHARDLLTQTGVVLIRCDVEGIYDLASMPQLDESGGGTGIHEWTASAFLIDVGSLIASVKNGDEATKDLIKGWCDRRAQHHQAALNAAHQQWRENDDA